MSRASNGDVETYIIGISGPTASGKTTLARLLRKIFTVTFTLPGSGTTVSIVTTILHQDDFYFPESAIPIRRVRVPGSNGSLEQYVTHADWDCAESIDFSLLKNVLERFRTAGCFSVEEHAQLLRRMGVNGIEETKSVGEERVPADVVEEVKKGVVSLLTKDLLATPLAETGNQAVKADTVAGQGPIRRIHILLVEGLLLYHDEKSVACTPDPDLTIRNIDHSRAPISTSDLPLLSFFDARILLHNTYSSALARRAMRQTYVVWPNYVRYHKRLYENGDMERGEVSEWAREVLGVQGVRADVPMEEVMRWACGIVAETVVAGRGRK
ncbi:hypothetical protein BDZ91DRAFT_708942 [Kalaharituber pfeilii]|nr:hypothetical protein BDZ91DRAFT_708942 [Kalaharituber pfeilii]